MAERHPDLGPLIADLGSGPDEATREALLRHVADCAECRAKLAAHDPTALFGVLALDPIPDGLLERLDERLAQELDAAPAVRPGRRLPRWAGVAAALVLAAVLGTYVVTRGPAPAGDIAQETSVTDAGRPAGVDAVELISSPGSAQVIDMTVGEVDLVMIFDEALNL